MEGVEYGPKLMLSIYPTRASLPRKIYQGDGPDVAIRRYILFGESRFAPRAHTH